MNYSPFNPKVWALFACFAAVTWLAVRAYRSKYPGYPGRWPEDMK